MFKERVEGADFKTLAMQAARIPAIGEDFYLVPNKATDKFYASLKKNGIADNKIFTTLASAYSNLTSGSGDTLFVCPGGYAQTAALTWAKHYTNLIGLGAPVKTNQRARITAATAALSPLITWSANGCLVDGVMFSQEGSHATTAAINMYLTGARNRFNHITLRNLGALAVVDNSCRTLKIASSDGENYFSDSTIGADTVDGVTATNYVIEFAAITGNQRQIFDNCLILGNGSANSSFVTAAAESLGGAWIMFKQCLFANPMGGALDQMTQAFALASDANGLIYMMDNLIFGAATLETSNTGILVGRNAYAAGTTDTGVALTF